MSSRWIRFAPPINETTFKKQIVRSRFFRSAKWESPWASWVCSAWFSFRFCNPGLILSAKNTAVNAAHEEARQGVLRLTRDIHAAISVPQLRDNGFAVISTDPVSGVPPMAAGVSFQNISSGPNFVWKDPGNPDLIMIKDNPHKPKEGHAHHHSLLRVGGRHHEGHRLRLSESQQRFH